MPVQVKQENAVDEFFKDLPSEDKKEQDIFDDKKEKEESKGESKSEEDTKLPADDEAPDSVKNRRHRRLEQQLQKERESNIALNERVKILSEQERFANEVEIDPRIARMFDTSDVGKENALRLSEVLSDMSVRAKEDALREIEVRQEQVAQEQKEYESFIDSELETLEDAHNVDLTSNAPTARKARREFLEMVQSLSPKDEDGTITGYADFGATFEIYQKTRTESKPDNTRRKEIANRSMEGSGGNASESKTVTPGFRGWEKDYNL